VKRRPLYSRSTRPRTAGASGLTSSTAAPVYVDYRDDASPPLRQIVRERWDKLYSRHSGKVLVAMSAIVTLLLVMGYDFVKGPQQNLSQRELNLAVNYAIDERPPGPSVASVAYATVIRSVVQVSGYETAEPAATQPGEEPKEAVQPEEVDEDFHERFVGVGTGVVIDDTGTILTNLHVAGAAPRLKVVFWDGTESEARIIGARPEQDLAIIMPDVLPDDLVPATMAASTSLNPGDEVVAVGFPFGIGPSASSGVISGLNRVLEEDGRSVLRNLIQFDAATNPGNSGGPLVNRNGEVVGIVTAILNPSGVRTFAGIAFAVPIESAAAGAGDNPL
jgi:serine protease DegQ